MLQFIQILYFTLSVYDPLKDFKHTLGANTAGTTFTAGFSLGEAHKETCNLYHTGIFIHNYQTTGTDDRIVFLDRIEVKRNIQMLLYQTSSGRSTDLNTLKSGISFESAADIISSAILTSTIIFMAVFFPVAMMGGTSGAFYTQFGITMAVAVGISAVNAFTLSPALCALLLKPYIDEQGNTKNNFAARFRKAFNAVFDSLSRRYVRGVMFIIHRRWLLWSIIGISFGLLVLLVNVTKTGLIPEEDTGTVMVSMNTKPGTSMAQTSKVMERINSRLDSIGEIEYSGAVAGFSFSGSGPSQAMYFVTLKDWEDRKGEGQSVNDVIGKIYAATSDIPDATVFAMSPPMIAGYGMGNGFELYLQDKAGGNIAAFKEEADKFVEALSQRPEIGEVYSSFATDYPQYWVDIDAAKCEQSGVSPADVLSTLSGYYTGQYVSDFNRFSKLYHVTMQAPAEYRVNAESLHHMYVRASDGGMSPLSRFVRLTKTNGPSDLTRFNLFNAISISGSPAQGYSSGQVLEAIGETAREVLPSNYTYEFGGISREESKTTNNAMVSKPSFDPNNVSENWDALNNDENSSLLNRATLGQYTPGSTFKLVTTLAFMRQNPDYNNYSFECNGEFSQNGATIHCYNSTAHGEESLTDSVANSCNSSFSNIGLQLDKAEWRKTAKQMLFNSKLPGDVKYNESSFRLKTDAGDADTMMTAIGQGETQVSPYHMAMLVSAIANGGKLMKPYLVDKITNYAGTTVKKYMPESYKELMTSSEAAQLTEYMKAVVDYGTGAALSGASYTVAGKTGTAEVSEDGNTVHSWFVGFSNVDNPELAISVCVEDADTATITGVSVAKQVFDSYYNN